MRERRQAGNSVVPLLLLLALLLGVGGWNYHRNVQLEQAEKRPFRGHSDENLAQLIAAYEAEQGQGQKRLDAANERHVHVSGKDYFQDQVNEFERVQRISRDKRARRDDLATSQATLKLLHAEQGKRAQERDKLKLFLRRAFTF